MRARFMHIADCHLGYRQYHLKERYYDFARTFLRVIDTAIDKQVDFVLLAGDLFEKRRLDALTLNQAISGLEKLRKAGIACLAVEGNHEMAYYSDSIGWMQFLALRGLLILLHSPFENGAARITPYAQNHGAYYDPVPGLRVYGLRYLGSGAAEGIEKWAAAARDVPSEGVEYTIFMTHAGIEGQVADHMGGLSTRQFAPLRPYADYVALGHIHKPYAIDDWIYNPGSLDNCSMSESQWPERGYYLVEVDTERVDANGAKHNAVLYKAERRPFLRFVRKIDNYASPSDFYASVKAFLERHARDFGAQQAETAPVVELQLTGVLPFDRSDLDLAAVQRIVEEAFSPLIARVRNLATTADYAVESGESLSRNQLERMVVADLFERDVRFRGKSESWADAAIELKRLALDNASPEAIVEELSHRMAAIAAQPLREDSERDSAAGESEDDELPERRDA